MEIKLEIKDDPSTTSKNGSRSKMTISEETMADTVAGYRVFQGQDSKQVGPYGGPLDPHAWYFEPEDYEGDVAFSGGFATRKEAQKAARNHVLDSEGRVVTRASADDTI